MNKLLQLLKDGRFHSGQELGAELGVSRGSVWKYLRSVEVDCGVEVHRVRGKGYRLASPISLLDREVLEAGLRHLSWRLFLYPTIDSTNAEALRLVHAPINTPFVVLAEAQSGGRGRRGRKWVSPYGQNLYCSVAYTIAGMQQLHGLSLVVGLAVMSALRDAGVHDAGLKWPNDVYAGGKKIAGVLLELSGDPADSCHVIIGIGINVNMLVTDESIGQPWTSVRAEREQLADRNAIALRLCESLHSHLARHAEHGFGSIREEWERSHIWQGRECQLSTATEQISGRVLGVNEQGELRLMKNGAEYAFSGGELSLRLAE